jgi:hypothetical protein
MQKTLEIVAANLYRLGLRDYDDGVIYKVTHR